MRWLVSVAVIAVCVLLTACDKNTPLMEKVIADDAAGAKALIAQFGSFAQVLDAPSPRAPMSMPRTTMDGPP